MEILEENRLQLDDCHGYNREQFYLAGFTGEVEKMWTMVPTLIPH